MGNQAAFSGIKGMHAEGGKPADISYFELTRSDHWNGTVFTVPEAGFYAFHMSFMRDITDQDKAKDGEGDDCNIKIYINGCPKQGAYVFIGENSVPRSSAAASGRADWRQRHYGAPPTRSSRRWQTFPRRSAVSPPPTNDGGGQSL